jgi:hypothetical protein
LIDQRQHGVKDDRLAPGDDHDLIGRDIYVAAAADVIGNRLAQLRQSGGRAVVGPPGVQGTRRGLDDVGWGVEIGLSDFQMDNALALPFEGFRLA